MVGLDLLHVLPIRSLFFAWWHGFLARLREMGEDVVADYFLRECVSSELACASGWWVGLACLVDGSNCGNQLAEALHVAWQRLSLSFPSRARADVLHVMQGVYKRWNAWFEWPSDTFLSFNSMARIQCACTVLGCPEWAGFFPQSCRS